MSGKLFKVLITRLGVTFSSVDFIMPARFVCTIVRVFLTLRVTPFTAAISSLPELKAFD